MKSVPLWLAVGLLGAAVLGAGLWITRRPSTATVSSAAAQNVRAPEAVAALGQLNPAGDVRRLAAPSGSFGGIPRVASLFVNEGDSVQKGQVLAIFDNRPQIQADLAEIDAEIRTSSIDVENQKREVARYAAAAKVGASSMAVLEEKQDELTGFQREGVELIARRRGLEAELADSALISPIDGVVLKINSRAGERPGPDGVLEVGANQTMEALIEVYESDINQISIGQPVSLISENGGFEGTLEGRVQSISPQVRQREVLSTDPTGDADARVIEVDVALAPESAERVTQLSGLKVIARFKAQ